MPLLARTIEGCAYSPEVLTAAFRFKNFGVIIHSKDMIVMNADNEAAAIEVIEFLKNIIANPDKITEKIKTY